MSIDLKYKEKVIAFLDIMGFKNIVNKPEPGFEKELIATLIELKGMEDSRKSLAGEPFNHYKQMTAFSDSIVISYDVSYPGAIFEILLDIIRMQIELSFIGLLFRGGVTIGEVFHDGGVVVGPGMVQAYELENKLAIYPRIIVDPILIEKAAKNPEKANNVEQELEYINGLLRKCENNYYYTDFLNMSTELEYVYDEFLYKMRAIIEKGLSETNLIVISKYEWLKNYYNEIVGANNYGGRYRSLIIE